MLSRDDQPAATPCAGCGGAAECEVWEHPTCYRCATAIGEVLPDWGQVKAAIGPDGDSAKFHKEFVGRWMRERRAQLSKGAA